MSNFKKLIETTKQLRSENGCPWDKEQTFDSLKPYIIEEAYEVISALDNNDYKNLKEEVGIFYFKSYLFQISPRKKIYLPLMM